MTTTDSPLIPKPPANMPPPAPAVPPATTDPRSRTPEYTVVRAENQGPEPFTAKYQGDTFHIPPGGQIFVPFYAMCLWAGHPDAIDVDRQRRYRTDELRRLQVRYGTHSFNGCWSTDVCNGNPGPSRDGVKAKHPPHRHLPDLHFFSIDTGEEYNTVLLDPEGRTLTTSTAQTQDTLESRAMRDLQSQIAALQRDLAAVQAGAGQAVPPPAPAPVVPPMPGGDGRLVTHDEPVDETAPAEGPLPAAVPVDKLPGSDSPSSTPGRKPRIPPSPGPLQ